MLYCGGHPGVTGDRIYGESGWNGRKFTLVDTGGIEPNTDNQILPSCANRPRSPSTTPTVIVLVTDIRRMTADGRLAGMSRRSKSPSFWQ